MLAAMKVIAFPDNIQISDGDDITDCILGASIIASGTPSTRTVTRNACPDFDETAGTCGTINNVNIYSSKAECVSSTKNYFTSLKTDNINIYTKAITNPKISDALAGEICAQYDD